MIACQPKTARREILPHGRQRVGRVRHASAERVRKNPVGPSYGASRRPDPIIGNPLSSQSLNPYSYIGNNPLSGTDPTGYIPVDMDSICGRSPGDCGAIFGTDSASALRMVSAGLNAAYGSRSGASPGQSANSAQHVTSGAEAGDPRTDISARMDGTPASPGNNGVSGKMLAQAADTPDADANAEAGSNGVSARAARERGIAPAVEPGAEGVAEAKLDEAKGRDPSYKPENTISALGNNNPIDQAELMKAKSDAWVYEVIHSGETKYTAAGRVAHQREPLPEGFERDVNVPGTRLRMDGYNRTTKEIIELKPNNTRQIRRGTLQLQRYCTACDQSELGPGHTARPVQTYDPAKYLDQDKN